jgi:hypothetical protein
LPQIFVLDWINQSEALRIGDEWFVIYYHSWRREGYEREKMQAESYITADGIMRETETEFETESGLVPLYDLAAFHIIHIPRTEFLWPDPPSKHVCGWRYEERNRQTEWL